MAGEHTDIAVVYLLRKANGEPPVKAFLESYLHHAAGVDHHLVILFKGFKQLSETESFAKLLGDLPYQPLLVSDQGYDLNAYFKAAALLPHHYLCFLNSYTRILCPNWLAFLAAHIDESHVGAVGATGSWESLYHNLLLQQRHQRPAKPGSKLFWPFKLVLARFLFPAFPNPHLRTTGFLCPRELFLQLRPPRHWSKFHALAFESGKGGFSAQLRSKGLEVLVVNQDNQSFSWPNWPQSRTFRVGQQEKLLLADNRTQQFAEASVIEQRWLAMVAWGEEPLSSTS